MFIIIVIINFTITIITTTTTITIIIITVTVTISLTIFTILLHWFLETLYLNDWSIAASALKITAYYVHPDFALLLVSWLIIRIIDAL